MPRDPRLYMTFPIDIHRHPKVHRLPAAVRWTFVEMNGEARIADNDGVFTEAEAEYLWPLKHLQALAASHPERPLVIHENATYTIRDYPEHQETKASREARAGTSRENGKKGGRPPKNPAETQGKPAGFVPKPGETQGNLESESESKSELEIPLDVTNLPGSSPEIPAGAEGLDKGLVAFITEERSRAQSRAVQLGVKDLWALHGLLETAAGQQMTAQGAVGLVEAILLKARDENVRDIDAYIATVCRSTPETVRDAYDAYDIGAVA